MLSVLETLWSEKKILILRDLFRQLFTHWTAQILIGTNNLCNSTDLVQVLWHRAIIHSSIARRRAQAFIYFQWDTTRTCAWYPHSFQFAPSPYFLHSQFFLPLLCWCHTLNFISKLLMGCHLQLNHFRWSQAVLLCSSNLVTYSAKHLSHQQSAHNLLIDDILTFTEHVESAILSFL